MHEICHDASVSTINAEVCIDKDSFCTNKHKICIGYAYLCIYAKKFYVHRIFLHKWTEHVQKHAKCAFYVHVCIKYALVI